jgi:hypothetical protein
MCSLCEVRQYVRNLKLIEMLTFYSTVIVHARWSNDSKTALLIASAYINPCSASGTLI